MDEPRRFDDKLVIELKQAFTDFLERYERDQKSIKEWQAAHEIKSDLWRTSLEEQIKPWKEFVNSVNMGWKLVIGLAAAVGILTKGISWVASHIKWNG